MAYSEALRAEIEEVKRTAFVNSDTTTDAEAVGVLLARATEWDGLEILRIAQYGLEDANFHHESGIVSDLADRVEKDS